MNVLEAIEKRRSYRGIYESTPVQREDLMKIVKAGVAAPSGCNMQTPSFIIVDDAEILRKLHELMPPHVGDTAPAAICVLSQRVSAKGQRCFATQDYSAAIENMLLAIVELGYQSCWLEGQVTDSEEINKAMARTLNVPDDYELVCLLPIGYGEGMPPVLRKKAFTDRVWVNTYGNSVGRASDR
ncbi:MAG: nitroreductase family protein [Lachnospiraceae bacterium]|nr:nitroreductase family protein [Lachnospiraceae bacterium]